MKRLLTIALFIATASIAWGQAPIQSNDDVTGIWIITWKDTGLQSRVILSQSKSVIDRGDIHGMFLSDDGHSCNIYGKDVIASVNFDIQCQQKNILLDGLLFDLKVKGDYWSGARRGKFEMERDPCQSVGGCESNEHARNNSPVPPHSDTSSSRSGRD